ncbi:MAG TPA: hypothetical protein VIJ19_09630 [Opitutaceae bacterium]
MNIKHPCTGGLRRILTVAFLTISSALLAQAPSSVSVSTASDFETPASAALQAMRTKADELHVQGVAVVAYSPGETVASWSSKMEVVGRMIEPRSDHNPKGSNLLGIAYAKASEMASTLMDSGKASRAPMIGEYGWQGGVTAKGATGTLIAAFSGGRSEDDVSISRAGLAVLAKGL